MSEHKQNPVAARTRPIRGSAPSNASDHVHNERHGR